MSANSKFGGLAAKVSETFRMPIISPLTDKPLQDKGDADGKNRKEAYLELLSADSEIGRRFDREQSQAFTQRAMRGRVAVDTDTLALNVAKIAALTTGWYLVDLDGQAIDVPFSPQNAAELYADPEMAWLYRQAFTAAHEVANFIKRSSTA